MQYFKLDLKSSRVLLPAIIIRWFRKRRPKHEAPQKLEKGSIQGK